MGPRTRRDIIKKRKIFPLPGIELRPLALPARSLVDILTEVFRFFEIGTRNEKLPLFVIN